MRSNGLDVINLGIGSPDLAPDIEVRNQMANSIGQDRSFTYQPYKGIPELTASMRNWYERVYSIELDTNSEIIPLMGSKEGIGFLALAYLNAGDEALVPNPGYPTYSAAVKIAGGTPVSYTLSAGSAWHPEVEELKKHVGSKTKVLFVNYPHMPTGQQADKEKLKEIIDFCKEHDILLCNDNPYSHTLSSQPFSLFQLEGAHDVGIEFNSLSKSHSMAGARVGIMVGDAALLEPIFKIQSSFSSGMFYPVQRGAIAAMDKGEEAFDVRNDIYSTRRELIWQLMDHLGCTYDRSSGGLFVWAKVPEHYQNGEALSDHLLETAHVFMTPGMIFGSEGNSYIRASLCQPENLIQQALNRIHQHQTTKS